MADFFLRAVGALLLCGFCMLSWGAATETIKRPMAINIVPTLGLEIWTEATPEWEVRTEARNGLFVFTAETPALTFPPAGMSWVSSPAIGFTSTEIYAGARGAIVQAARNYGFGAPGQLHLQPATYGELTGYEASFAATANGTPVDVKIFCGHRPGKPAVVMQAFTLQGKLSQLSEHIRRSWTHVRYLG